MIRKFCLTLAVISAAMYSTVTAQQTGKVTSSGIGYLEYLPDGYNSNSNKYPIVISLHGIKEKGTSSNDPALVKASLPKVANVGLPKYVKYGQKYPFILISPQLKSNMSLWTGSYVIEVLNHVKKYLRVDEQRIYLTGLSLGGFGVWRTAGDYPHVFAAIVPICPGGNALSKASVIAAQDVASWGFHGTSDNIVHYSVTTKMINAMNGCSDKPNPLAKTTLFAGMGHSIWDKVYKETNALNWMLGFRNGSAPSTGTSSNNAPMVSAGSDKTITLPTNSIYIQGSASDSDGSVASYKWTKVSGGAASLSATTSSKFRAYNLAAGNYVFRLTVKDNDGATRSDDMSLTVKSSTANAVPVANAGSDKTITLPTNSIYIQGSGSDKDGSIASYRWTKVSGGSASMSGVTSSKFRAYNLTAGTYVFRLTVKDNKGAAKSDDMRVIVNKASSTNSLPHVYAGPDKTLYLPTNSIYVQAQASDKDGSIASYKWVKTYGGSVSMSGTTSPKVRIYNMKAGAHIFRLTVTDNDGGVKHDYFKITVKSSTSASATTTTTKTTTETTATTTSVKNIAPVANAGADRRIKLPRRSVELNGSATDRDGSIVSYQWRKLSGPDLSLQGKKSPDLTITDLKTGRYYFSLTVEDNDGATHVDKMALYISGS